jgi:Leucine-rich repeat (LRR) protein
MCFFWLVWRLWKVAAPPPESTRNTTPSAIKGLLPWGVADGELFARLGRDVELHFLLDRAQNDQIPITVVRGESGAGKTSLLQAGLQFTLKRENCVYWEARPNNAPAELLHAIQNQFPEIESLDSLPAGSKGRWVLILDQFEQLQYGRPEHVPVFELLERIAKEPAPHRLSAVIGFRREYQADWSDFELAQEFRAEQVAVKLMTRPVAGDVIATLAGRAGFALEQDLVDNFLANVAQDSLQSGRVSPLDMSIGLESLANFAQQRGVDRVTMGDYELAGGAEGLLLVFVQQKLDEVPEPLRVPLLNGIVLSLVDLATNQRVAEGESAAVIANQATLPVETLKPWLNRLTNPRVRLLESVAPDRYRLPHERLVPVLRRLTGTALASLDHTRLLLEGEYARWRQTHSRRHLLSGGDLTEVLRYREQLIPGENAGNRTEYLEACLGRRRLLRMAGAGVGIAVAGSAYGAYRGVDALQQRARLKSWGLPPELFALQHELDGLEIGSINEGDWLRSTRLRELSVRFTGSSLAGLEQLKGLTTLTLDETYSGITSLDLAGLEQLKGLTTLTLHLSNSDITSLAGLEQLKGLTILSLDLGESLIHNLAGLEQLKGLTTLTLDLRDSYIHHLAGLEQLKGLTTFTLDVRASRVTSLAGLEQLKGLTTLAINSWDITSLDLAGLEQLKGLTTLAINFSYGDITSLDLAGLKQLKGLTTLTLNLSGSKVTSLDLAALEQLKGLTTLAINFSYGDITSLDLAGLKQLKGLTTLTLNSRGSKVTSLAGLEQLKGLTTLTLDVSKSGITSLAALEQLKELTTLSLNLSGSKVTSLAGLEQLKGLTTLTLDVSKSGITSLAPLEQLKALASVRIWLPLSQVANIRIRANQVFVGCRI